MYEFTVFRKPNNLAAQWQLRHEGKLVAATLVGKSYTAEIEGVLLKVHVSMNRWVTISPGLERSPALQPMDVLQPGKDIVAASYLADDLGIGEVAQGWLKTAFPMWPDSRFNPGGSITASRLE